MVYLSCAAAVATRATGHRWSRPAARLSLILTSFASKPAESRRRAGPGGPCAGSCQSRLEDPRFSSRRRQGDAALERLPTPLRKVF
jgi:hypothetical protein